KENAHSRAYILFKSTEALVNFHRGYDGHAFRDKQGNESFAVVEYATYQKVPVERKKVDPKQGTIDDDPDFLSFLESLKPTPKPDAEALAA
ncbi:regulator of nonsense-mediated decay, partial [Mrakia frigida]|uniref:RNA-binding protein n=1 Tax=Mrakia frigida TaxID=29902 RepID=UPI003FCBF663